MWKGLTENAVARMLRYSKLDLTKRIYIRLCRDSQCMIPPVVAPESGRYAEGIAITAIWFGNVAERSHIRT